MKIKVTAKDSDYFGLTYDVAYEIEDSFIVKGELIKEIAFRKSRCKVVKRFYVERFVGYCEIYDKETKSKYQFVSISYKKKDVLITLQHLGITADKREIKIKK